MDTSSIFKKPSSGGAAYDVHNEHFPEATHKVCQSADAILFGSVGGPVGGPVNETQKAKWQNW